MSGGQLREQEIRMDAGQRARKENLYGRARNAGTVYTTGHVRESETSRRKGAVRGSCRGSKIGLCGSDPSMYVAAV